MSNVFNFLQHSYEKYPNQKYVIDKEREWTYSEVYDQVNKLTQYLGQYSINNGDRILIYLDNSVEYITAFFSTLLINAIIVPINKNTTVENLQYIVKDTAPRVIISNGILFKKIKDKINFGDCKEIELDCVQVLRKENNIDFLSSLNAEVEAPALILYTSGTTRMPKGVTLTHKNLIANTLSILQYLELQPSDSILATINFSYSYGNSIFLTHTKIGGTIIIENRMSFPIKVLEQMALSQATGFSTVGSYINLLLKQEGLENKQLQYLRYITFAGESTSFEDIIKLNKIAPHIKIFVMYGQTEACARLSYLEPTMLFKKAGSIGKGIPGVQLRVVKEDNRDASPGEVGEIIAFGDNIMKGYWNNAVQTQEVIKNGWLFTGDLATVDEDGYIYVKGRNDDMIKYLGHRISPLEIEAVINSCEQVLESAVIGIDSDQGKQIKAYIIPRNETYHREEIAAYIRKLLPSFKRPQIMEFTNNIPRTVNGKIKRSDLRNINL